MEPRTIDSLIKIKNGCMGRVDTVLVFRSFEVSLILDFMLKHYFIATYSLYDRNHFAIKLRYLLNNKSVINNINVISRVNKPVYMQFRDIKKNFSSKQELTLFRAAYPYYTSYVRNGLGIDMIATRKTGIVEIDEIMKHRTGAEVLLTIN
jgi:ribosomal protein S8